MGAPINVDTLVGCLMIATWINMVFFGIQLTHIYKYFKYYSDETYMRILVVALTFIDVCGMAGELSSLYLSAITYYGNMNYLKAPEAGPRGTYLVAIQITGCIVQCYLITRIWRLSRKLWLAIPLWLGSVLSLAGGLALTCINLIYKALSERWRQVKVLSVWLVTAAVVDLLIAFILIFLLWRIKRETKFQQTQNVLSRLMASSLETGSLTAVLAILVEVMFQTMRGTNLQIAFVWLLGRAYCLTLTFNLLQRRDLRNRPATKTNGGLSGLESGGGVTLTNVGRSTKMLDPSSPYPIEIQVASQQLSRIEPQSHLDLRDDKSYAV
ncbi:hypothetical protein DL96DRAFT_1705901 [Flagelloscypha sp. PMI_526]|nr:hypothetical protein DL96DRAFT_1705901 [Flagelloscypha sp. PMI_526]